MLTRPLVINIEHRITGKFRLKGTSRGPDQEVVSEGSWKPPRTETAWSLWTVCTTAGLFSWGKNVPLQPFWTSLVSMSVVPHHPTMHCYEETSSISLMLSPAAAVGYPQIIASPGCTSPHTPVPPCRTIAPVHHHGCSLLGLLCFINFFFILWMSQNLSKVSVIGVVIFNTPAGILTPK